jgi:16S rRNA A1518/A1519 N6-dimethyltransferase RsmA/KsgA/DIM1 with predicted DNA glycosylase/AP lyase activity
VLILIAVIIGFILFSFSFVLLFGAPFLPTLKQQVNEALNLLNLEPGQTMLELGCGDGRVLVAAAQRDLTVIGYELNPILAVIAWVRTRRYRSHVVVIWGDFWHASWPPAQGIFGFILPRYMSKLNNKLVQYPHKPIRVASFAFAIPGKEPAKISKGIFLYEYIN